MRKEKERRINVAVSMIFESSLSVSHCTHLSHEPGSLISIPIVKSLNSCASGNLTSNHTDCRNISSCGIDSPVCPSRVRPHFTSETVSMKVYRSLCPPSQRRIPRIPNSHWLSRDPTSNSGREFPSPLSSPRQPGWGFCHSQKPAELRLLYTYQNMDSTL
jgi:hypothetical protein